MCSAYCHSDSENLIDYHESDAGTVVVTMTFGVMMVNVLFHDALSVMASFIAAIPVTIAPAILIAVSMGIPFAPMPSVVMSVVCLVAVVMVFTIIVVSFAVSATICPCVAAQGQNKSNQNDACHYEFPCHANLLYVGLRTSSLWSV